MSTYEEVKAELGDGPPYVRRSDFNRVFGYSKGAYLGEFRTVEEAFAEGATATEAVCDEDAYKLAHESYATHLKKVYDEWRRRVRSQYVDVNDAVFEIIFAKAWEDGHSAGYGEVELYVDDYVDFATGIIAASEEE
jgi:hypothetical protein